MLALALPSRSADAQRTTVLQLDPADAFGGPLPVDRGASGVRQRLLELGTFASVMQVTAHPDDEQAGLLTYLSRGTGARTALLTLNRGEAGANAVGSELFDALGLLRNEELLLADHYYGLDDQYFTSAADYGFSKTIAEAARSWDTTAVLRDMVRIIRLNRPLVVIARWYGAERDGHGHHQFAGAIAPLAVAAAADPQRFPELERDEGLAPWRVRRLFRANVRAGERADVVIDAGRYDPWLGTSYQAFGGDGYARQRSQTAGRRSTSVGPSPQRLQLVTGDAVVSDDDPFAGMNTSLPSLYALTGEVERPEATAALRDAAEAARRALASFSPGQPWEVIPHLLDGLRATRHAAVTAAGSPGARSLIEMKERQFERAIVAALALQVTAVAGAPGRDGHAVVPGERVPVQLTVSIDAPANVTLGEVRLAQPQATATASVAANVALTPGEPWHATLSLDVTDGAETSRPAFVRDGIASNHYRWRIGSPDVSARPLSAARVAVTVAVHGVPIVVERSVRIRESREPEGTAFPRLVIVPPVSLQAQPAVRVVTRTGAVTAPVTVEVTGFREAPVNAEVSLRPRVGTTVSLPASGAGVVAPQTVRLSRGERRTLTFHVTLPDGRDSLTLEAVARVDGREWRDVVTPIIQRELEPAYLYATPTATVRRVAVSMPRGLSVGYVMGVGDLVPDAIAQLGARVTRLDASTVAAGDFARFDAVVIGTRAYAVRPELAAATRALTEYARRGGNVVVLYQTQEWKPETMAPFRALLPDDAEETTEEDAPVTILAPHNVLLTSPNRLTAQDFTGWIEQRGSKFLTSLAPEYTALVETHDTGQAPQRGVWVTARVGRGRWSYVALALHRQLPYGVPGAYRLLANLLTPPARVKR